MAEQELAGIRNMLWGADIKRDIFKRWSQGFYFSVSEPTALEQSEGGPCAVIAPVQAFILKNLTDKYKDLSFRDRELTADSQNVMLINAACEILQQCQGDRYHIVSLQNDDDNNVTQTSPLSSHPTSTATSSTAPSSPSTVEGALNGVLLIGCPEQPADTSARRDQIDDPANLSTLGANAISDPHKFHAGLKWHTFTALEDVRQYYGAHASQLREPYGVLLFLYSVMATRTLEKVRSDSCSCGEEGGGGTTAAGGAVDEPLIDHTYGYGSQSLINLMVTGRATTYVWDHEQDVGGLKLKGLERQSSIGFITIMEHLRYCTVGSFYKNPTNPVWVVASDTHLTVIFSTERRLVSPETKSEEARRVFRHFDPDGNNFISSTLLGDVLQMLDLVSEEAYVDLMRKRLDPESLGIILLNGFMDEFFPAECLPSTPDLFTLHHYNGLPQSNALGQIRYRCGECVLLETDLRAVSESNAMLTVLQTKWPNIEVKWDGGTPSLN